MHVLLFSPTANVCEQLLLEPWLGCHSGHRPLSLRLLLLHCFITVVEEKLRHFLENMEKTRDSLPWVGTLDLHLYTSLHLFTNTDSFTRARSLFDAHSDNS